MNLIDNLSYRQWQKRNSLFFNQLDKLTQQKIRKKGYCNRGWNQVKKSWTILQECQAKVVTIFDHKLAKGDLQGAINTAILDSKHTKNIARSAIATLEKNQQRLDKLTKKTLNKYQPL